MLSKCHDDLHVDLEENMWDWTKREEYDCFAVRRKKQEAVDKTWAGQLHKQQGRKRDP